MITYLNGEVNLFNEVSKCFATGLIKSVDNPGNNHLIYLLSNTTDQYFIKPTKDSSWKKEVLAYQLAKNLNLDQYLLPITAFQASNDKTTQTFTAAPMLPDTFIAIQDFERERPGSMNGILQKMIDSGDAHKLAVFDYLIKNHDRHRSNVQTDGSKVILIDHDNAFADGHWSPAYLRVSTWKSGDALPLCKDYSNLNDWFAGLKFKNEMLQKRLEEIKNAPGIRIDEKVNSVWQKI